jgi:hypothetical protein
VPTEVRKITGLGVKLQGHVKILEYSDRAAYEAGEPCRTLLNRRNAIHKENAVNLVVNALTDRRNGSVAYMVFGNGGTTLDNTGTVNFKAPHVTGVNQDLYSPIFFQLVDDRLGALPGNQMAVRHIHGTTFTDIDIRCLIDATQPFSQLPNDEVQPLYLKTTNAPGSPAPTTQFYFDEIGLKLADGTLLTHVVFAPIFKTASSLLEVVYTLRLFVGSPGLPAEQILVNLQGVEATTETGQFAIENIPCVGAVRFNNSPYFTKIPAASGNSSVGSLSLWIRSADIFTMAHDQGPALLSSALRTTMDISGRGYIRRNPSAISRTNPCQITVPNHGLSNGATVEFTHVDGGCSELQGLTETITVVDNNNFTVPVDATGFAAAYTGPAQLTFPTHAKDLPNTLRIVFRDSETNPTKIFYWNSHEQIPIDQWVNLLISWDMNHPAGQKILQVWVDDTEWTSTSDPTYIYDPDSAFTVEYTSSPAWILGEPVTVPRHVNVAQVAREVLRSRT